MVSVMQPDRGDVTGNLLINAFYAVQWLFFIGLLPIVIAWWRPELRVINLLLWSYLGGHLVSTAYAVAEGAAYASRYDGLTHHPNAFGLAVSRRSRSCLLVRQLQGRPGAGVPAGFVAIGLLSIVISGSRAAIVVLVVHRRCRPARRAVRADGCRLAAIAALGVLSIPFIVDISGEESAIGRLAGSGTASASDRIREAGLEVGFDRLWESPILGSGFNNVEEFHNVFLEAAIAIGFIGLFGYLMVLYPLARPLFSGHPLRRLTYMVWVFMGVGPTFPGLWDRTVWVPASLAALAMLASTRQTTMQNAPADPEVEPARSEAGQPRSRLTWS